MSLLQQDFDSLSLELQRLQTENGLLREASTEQRILNGKLRQELQSFESRTKPFKDFKDKEIISLVEDWVRWCKTWSILVDGTALLGILDLYKRSLIIVPSVATIESK